MKVLEQGTWPKESTKHVGTCTVCKSRVRFNNDEVHPLDDDSDKAIRISFANCPVCDIKPIYVAIEIEE